MDELKHSFDPISSHDSTILILGSLPGDRSIQHNEYYAHPSNRFWKVIASIKQAEIPVTYVQKRNLLLQNRIALWDVAHSAIRSGSLDSSIQNEIPNKIDEFISAHPNLKLIGFNGKKPETLYRKYFQFRPGIRYVSLPSTSPANAGISLEQLITCWKKNIES